MAVLLASTSDLDDLIPTLVAYQVEWNKLHAAARAAERPAGEEPDPAACADGVRRRGGGLDRASARPGAAWARSSTRCASRRLNLRIRMLGGSQAGYARMTRRWWRAGARRRWTEQGLGDRPIYFVSSNPHSMVNLRHADARARARPTSCASSRSTGPHYLREELERFREGRAEGSWENFLYFAARLYCESSPRTGRSGSAARAAERAVGVTHISSRAALRVSAQVIALDKLDPAGLDPRLGEVDAEQARATRDGGGRQHRVSARARRLQHPARDHRRRPTCCAASTCSARRRR